MKPGPVSGLLFVMAVVLGPLAIGAMLLGAFTSLTMKTKPKPTPKLPEPSSEEDNVIRVWPETIKKPPPRYRIEDANPGD